MIELHQIYYEENQKVHLFPFAIPYFNETLTPFFENTIIVDKVLTTEADKIAVCSWSLKEKMRRRVPPRRELNEAVLYEDFDVMSFSKNASDHDMLGALETWHFGSSLVLKLIFEKLGIIMPKKPKFPIYQNAFCAKTEIYKEYVTDFLIPAMNLMTNDEEVRELCWKDSGYTRTILNMRMDMERVKNFLGTDYVPLHPFLLERCFSLWIDNKNLNVVYL
jgi:hypothetical protein